MDEAELEALRQRLEGVSLNDITLLTTAIAEQPRTPQMERLFDDQFRRLDLTVSAMVAAQMWGLQLVPVVQNEAKRQAAEEALARERQAAQEAARAAEEALARERQAAKEAARAAEEAARAAEEARARERQAAQEAARAAEEARAQERQAAEEALAQAQQALDETTKCTTCSFQLSFVLLLITNSFTRRRSDS